DARQRPTSPRAVVRKSSCDHADALTAAVDPSPPGLGDPKGLACRDAAGTWVTSPGLLQGAAMPAPCVMCDIRQRAIQSPSPGYHARIIRRKPAGHPQVL